jgi:hypothetical protein
MTPATYRTHAKDARNYEAGMVITFNERVKGFRAGEFFEVLRVVEGSVFVRAGAGERRLPLLAGHSLSPGRDNWRWLMSPIHRSPPTYFMKCPKEYLIVES